MIVVIELATNKNGLYRIAAIREAKNLKKDDSFNKNYRFLKVLDSDGSVIFGNDTLGRFGIGNRRELSYKRNSKGIEYELVVYVPDNFDKDKYIGKLLL